MTILWSKNTKWSCYGNVTIKKKKKKKNAMGTLIRNENASFGGNLGKPNAILPYSNNPA